MHNLREMLDDTEGDHEQLDAKVLNLYTTLGHYDLIAIIEAPDAIAAPKVSALIASQGNFRAETLPAVTVEKFIKGGVDEEF